MGILPIIQAIISFFTSVLPELIKLIGIIKSQPTPIQVQALGLARDAAKAHCDGVGCSPEPVKG